MKTTQKLLLVFAIFMAFSMVLTAQTRQERKALKAVDLEILNLEAELSSLEAEIASSTPLDTMTTFLRKQELVTTINGGQMTFERMTASKRDVNRLEAFLQKMRVDEFNRLQTLRSNQVKANIVKARLVKLYTDREKLIDNQLAEAIDKELPSEMLPYESRRRHRSNGVRRENHELDVKEELDELNIKKMIAAPVVANPTKGYFGKVSNSSKRTTYTFVFKGTETKKFVVSPGQVVGDYLLPGTYTCEVYAYGVKIGTYGPDEITAKTVSVKGEELHWYGYQEVDTRAPIRSVR